MTSDGPIQRGARHDAGKEFGDTVEGEVVVFEPRGNDEFVLVARVAPDDWSRWAKERSAAAK